MLPRIAILILLAAVLQAAVLRADDKWLVLRSGPFEVMTGQGDKAGREALNRLEQLRYTFGTMIGKPQLKSPFPIRILLSKDARKGDPIYSSLELGRDSFVISVPALDSEAVDQITKLLLETNAGVIPQSLELGLVEFFSTLDVDGTRVTVGAKPPHPTRDWSRVHMLCVDPRFSGKLRVLLYNLQQGVEEDAAYKNAFEMPRPQIEEQLNKYIEAQKFETTNLSGRPLDPKRQLFAKPLDPIALAVARADNLLAHSQAASRAAYEEILRTHADSVEARDGLGLAAALVRPITDAKTLLSEATEKGSKNARVWFELGKLESGRALKASDFAQAASLNPAWPDPALLLADAEKDPARKVAALKLLVKANPRKASLWVQLAQAQEAALQYNDSVKSWGSAERVAATSEERAAIHRQRTDTESMRLDQQEAKKREALQRTDQELQDLKNKATADLRAFEAKANAQQGKLDPNTPIIPYRGDGAGNAYSTIAGNLIRVDCIGTRARWSIRDSTHQIRKLLVEDPTKLVILGGGERALSCGTQKPAPEVNVDYVPKPDTSLGTAGEIAKVEFR